MLVTNKQIFKSLAVARDILFEDTAELLNRFLKTYLPKNVKPVRPAKKSSAQKILRGFSLKDLRFGDELFIRGRMDGTPVDIIISKSGTIHYAIEGTDDLIRASDLYMDALLSGPYNGAAKALIQSVVGYAIRNIAMALRKSGVKAKIGYDTVQQKQMKPFLSGGRWANDLYKAIVDARPDDVATALSNTPFGPFSIIANGKPVIFMLYFPGTVEFESADTAYGSSNDLTEVVDTFKKILS